MNLATIGKINLTLSALGAAVYLATTGRSGLRQVARLCYDKAHYAAARIGDLPGLKINPQAPERPFFKEFVVRLPKPVAPVNRVLLEDFGIIGGYDLGVDYPQLGDNTMLLCATEMVNRTQMDRLVEKLPKENLL